MNEKTKYPQYYVYGLAIWMKSPETIDIGNCDPLLPINTGTNLQNNVNKKYILFGIEIIY